LQDRDYKTLIIEDHPDQAQLMELLLKRHRRSFSIEIVHDPVIGLEKLSQNTYDALILDYSLPNMNGLETLAEIKKRKIAVPVIMVTGQGDERIAVKAMQQGAQDYLTKTPDYLNLLPDVVVRAIEERRLSSRLHQIEHSYFSLFENASVAVFIVDARTLQVLQVNKMASQLLEIPQSQLLKQSFLDICSSKSVEKMRNIFAEINEKKHISLDNLLLVQANRRVIPTDMSCSLVQVEGEEVVQLFIRDIREKVKMRQQLLLSRQRLISLFDGITDLISVQDAEHNLVMGNKRYLQFTKHTNENISGEKCFKALFNRDEPCANCPAYETYNTGESRFIEIFHNGRTFHIWTFPMEGLDGKPQFLVEYAKDVTEQKEIEKQLIKSEKLATLGILSSGIAHELRNPLSIIETARYTIEDDLRHQYEDIDKKLEIIKRNIRRASIIIDNLLQFSRNSEFQKEKVDVENLIDSTLSLFQKEISVRNIQIDLLFNNVPRLFFSIDSLKQVFLNIIMNAVQAMPKGGILKIITSLSSDRRWVFVDFSDNGVGIPKENMKYIFTPFFTTKSSTGGTGLGLYLSYSIIKKEGGDIAVQSKPGIGTTFSIKLPVATMSDVPY